MVVAVGSGVGVGGGGGGWAMRVKYAIVCADIGDSADWGVVGRVQLNVSEWVCVCSHDSVLYTVPGMD